MSNEFDFSEMDSLVQDRLFARPVNQEELIVNVHVQGVGVSTYVSGLYTALEARANALGGTVPVSEDELLAYIRELIQSRVLYVTPASARTQKYIVGSGDRIAIPSILYMCMAALGRIEDLDLGLVFVPVVKDPIADPKRPTAGDMANISSKLFNMNALGLTVSANSIRDREGSLDVMSMRLEEDKGKAPVLNGLALSYRPTSHPSAAVYATLFGLTRDDLSDRKIYGDHSRLLGIINELATERQVD